MINEQLGIFIAKHCKDSLASMMVREFPELEGSYGRHLLELSYHRAYSVCKNIDILNYNNILEILNVYYKEKGSMETDFEFFSLCEGPVKVSAFLMCLILHGKKYDKIGLLSKDALDILYVILGKTLPKNLIEDYDKIMFILKYWNADQIIKDVDCIIKKTH